MDTIGSFTLKNAGGFVAKGGVTCNGKHYGYTGDIDSPQSEKYDPGQFGNGTPPEVPDGATVEIYVDVVWGENHGGTQQFTYKSGSTNTANYTISGTTLSNKLTYGGLS